MQKTNVVHVKANREGKLIMQNQNNPKFGSFMVVDEGGINSFTAGFDAQGRPVTLVFPKRSRQCFVTLPWEYLEPAVASGEIEDGMVLPGKIVIWESLNQEDLFASVNSKGEAIGVTPETGIKYRSAAHKKVQLFYAVDGAAIYQRKFYTENLTIGDKLVTATNTPDVNDYADQQIAAGNVNLVADFIATKKVVGKK